MGNNIEDIKNAIKEAIKLGDEKIGTSRYARQGWIEVKDILREKYNIEEDRSNYMDVPYENPIDKDRKRYSG